MAGARRWLAAGVVAALPACSPTGPGCGEELRSVSALTYGRVATEAGSPVPDARIQVWAYRGACGVGTPTAESASPGATDASGQYRVTIRGMTAPHAAECVQVRVEPPPGSGLAGAAAAGGRVTLSAECGAPPDSIRVDVVLGGRRSGPAS